jgi:hypothetical protein
MSLLDENVPSIGISEPILSIINGYFTCKFKRQKLIDSVKNYFDLNKPNYLLAAVGQLRVDLSKNIVFFKELSIKMYYL